MALPFRWPRLRARRARVLAAASLIVIGSVSAAVLDSPAARADPTVHTIVQGAPQAWAPYLSGTSTATDLPINANLTISCYVTGDSVTGPYGAENVWDLVSGGSASQTLAGTFIPDADVYTGSNSPVVPRCTTALGTTLDVSSNIPIWTGPGTGTYLGLIGGGEKLEFKCYSSGTSVTGPYGSETTWDLLTITYLASQVWAPDADIYTGSNSPVVPHC
jgi:hypothetical protein